MSRGSRQDELPAANDPIWHEWAGGVLAILTKPLTIEQLKEWARRESFEVGRLINSLAWLDMRGLISADRIDGVVFWRRAVPKNKPVLKPPPKYCVRCNGLMRVEPERIVCINCGESLYPPPDTDSDDN